MPSFQTSQNIMTYAALPGEVQTGPLIRKMLAMKKNVFLPRIHSARRPMSIFQIYHPSRDLRKGRYGILQPRPLKTRKGNPKNLDLVLVPGVGFDRKGSRLGRGAGYFDRFLKKAKRSKKIALAFREQVLGKIPHGPHDVLMDRVITD